MAIQATFDMPIDDAVREVTSTLDGLHDVSYTSDAALRDRASIEVFLNETPMWVYPAAALVGAAPWLLAAFAPFVEVTISSTDGMDVDLGDNSSGLLVVAGLILVALAAAAAFAMVTRIKRPARQSTITAVPEERSQASTDPVDAEPATIITMEGSAERYVHVAVRRCFDKFDRYEIAKRAAEAQGGAGFSIRDFLEVGPRPGTARGLFGGPGPAPEGSQASEVGQAPQDSQAGEIEQTDEELGR